MISVSISFAITSGNTLTTPSTALTEGGHGAIPWLLALRAEKLPR